MCNRLHKIINENVEPSFYVRFLSVYVRQVSKVELIRETLRRPIQINFTPTVNSVR